MSRAPIESRPSTAQWLIAAREAAGFSNAPDFLAAVKAAEGKAPSYSTYAQWESGSVTPRSSTLATIRHFHEARETKVAKAPQPGPDLATALLAQATALADLATELGELRKERTALAAKVEELDAWVRQLVQGADGGEGSGAAGARHVPRATAG